MNREEKLVLFKTLKDLMEFALSGRLPRRYRSIGEIDDIMEKLEPKEKVNSKGKTSSIIQSRIRKRRKEKEDRRKKTIKKRIKKRKDKRKKRRRII